MLDEGGVEMFQAIRDIVLNFLDLKLAGHGIAAATDPTDVESRMAGF